MQVPGEAQPVVAGGLVGDGAAVELLTWWVGVLLAAAVALTMGWWWLG